MNAPSRGFDESEYRERLKRAQDAMAEAGLDALLLTTEPDVRYFTGFLTRFWESPTRPWFLVVPCAGDPIAVIPAIGAALMGRTWISDIRTWRAPEPEDDGVSLLGETLREACGPSGAVGLPMMLETHLRMPLADFERLRQAIAPLRVRDDNAIMRSLRMIKSEAEIEKIRAACAIADRAFARVHEIAASGISLDEVFRRFQMLCLEEGADWVPYLAGAAGVDGYSDVISPATGRALLERDVLMLDTGLIWDGYFCDFDRNFSVSATSNVVARAHARLLESIDAAVTIARPGATAADLYHAINKVVAGGADGGDTGRLGHGLGMQLTEGLSLIPDDHTVLAEGMVLTLEPSIETAPGRLLVHEENIVIRKGAPEFLSKRAVGAMPVLA